MTKITFEGQEYVCPESYDEITLNDLISIESIHRNYAEKNQSMQIIAAVYGIPVAVQNRMPVVLYAKVVKALGFLDTMPQGLAIKIKAGGIEFKAPELYTESTFRQWTVAAYYHNKYQEEARAFTLASYVAAIYYLPENETFEQLESKGEKAFESRVKQLRGMSGTDATGVVNFFLTISQIFDQDSRQSLLARTEQTMQNLLGEVTRLKTSMAGSPSSQTSRINRFGDSIKCSINQLIASLRSYPTLQTNESSNVQNGSDGADNR